MEKITSIEQFENVADGHKEFFILKHSLTCPISKAAFEEYKSFAAENSGVNIYYLAVQEARDLSNYIAEKTGIKHESPQAMFFVNNKVTWHASHWQINKSILQEILQKD